MRDLLICLERIRHGKDSALRLFERGLGRGGEFRIDKYRLGSFCKCLCRKLCTVKVLSAQRNKEIPGSNLARIRCDPRNIGTPAQLSAAQLRS